MDGEETWYCGLHILGTFAGAMYYKCKNDEGEKRQLNIGSW
jgi:hypothetical protein